MTSALVKCTPAKTFFCGWGTQKHEQGALRFLRSCIHHILLPESSETELKEPALKRMARNGLFNHLNLNELWQKLNGRKVSTMCPAF